MYQAQMALLSPFEHAAATDQAARDIFARRLRECQRIVLVLGEDAIIELTGNCRFRGISWRIQHALDILGSMLRYPDDYPTATEVLFGRDRS